MNINFTGLKNISYKVNKYTPEENEDFKQECEEHFLTVQLTDDFNGKDLTEFKNKVKTSTLKNYNHPINPDLLNIQLAKEEISDNCGDSKELSIYVNEADDELKIDDKNLPMISFIAQLLTKISKQPEDKFTVNNEYLEKDAATSIVLGEDLREDYGPYYNDIIRDIHSPRNVKPGAKEMSDMITAKMIDYFS